jgi:hypothetical protein
VLAPLAIAFLPAGASAAKPDRYDIVHGCFALKLAGGGDFVKQTGAGYSLDAATKGDAEPFRMQATDLGSYLFFGQAEDFLALDSGPLAGDDVIVAGTPSNRSDWIVKGDQGVFTITSKAAGLGLAVGAGGAIVSVPKADADKFRFARTTGCAEYPEVEVNVSGKPRTGLRYGEVKGFTDAHMHMMAFEFLSGHAHCGQPWHKFGVEYALADCADHTNSGGCGAVLETGVGGDPCHNPDGWPTFQGWPKPDSLTHESSYYKWLERAYRGGLRVFVNLYVENRVLCEVYPDMSAVQGKPKTSCDEMETVERERKRLFELQDYIDAQEGGPGEGWFRIVRSPFQARRVIAKGKLAVVQAMEVSEPFDCGYKGIYDPIPGSPVPDSRCSEEHITEWLDTLKKWGVSQMEITNKFDNQLTGVAGDGGSTGVLVNSGQFLTSGSFWDYGTCEDPDNHDRVPATGGAPASQDEIFGNGLDAFGLTLPVLIPTYTAGHECNQKGLTALGEHAVKGIADRGIIFDPDHMSVKARDQALTLVEGMQYPGVLSSHSWSTRNTLPRVYGLGGFIAPYAGNATSFVGAWQTLKEADVRNQLGDQYFGVGYGADANGLGAQGDPRNPAEENDVDYPFESFDGATTIGQQVSGEKTYDINSDGVAHYGLYPDWVEDLRQLAGDEIVNDMARGAEAYLQTWERARGIPPVDCSTWTGLEFDGKGIGPGLRVNRKPRRALRQAGQPVKRKKLWRYCAGNGRGSEKRIVAAFGSGNRLDFVISNLETHELAGVGPGDSKRNAASAGTRISKNVYFSRTGGRRTTVWTLGDKGKVSHVGVASQRVAKKPGRLARRLTRVAAKS